MEYRNHWIILFILIITPFSTLMAEPFIHVLKKGETLYSLARQYGIEISILMEENGITDPGVLSVGMSLTIPQPQSNSGGSKGGKYTVVSGDTYYSIARQFGMTVGELYSLNSRDKNRVLKPGEILSIASGSSSSPGTPQKILPATISKVSVEGTPRWPVKGFKSPLTGKLQGVVIEAEPASYIHAVSSGEVVWTGPYRGFGQVILVDSNGYIYLYGGSEDLFVNVGQFVSPGHRIGRLSESSEPGKYEKMIFSVFRNGKPIPTESAPRS